MDSLNSMWRSVVLEVLLLMMLGGSLVGNDFCLLMASPSSSTLFFPLDDFQLDMLQ